MHDPLRTKARLVFFTAIAFFFGIGVASGMGWTGPSYAQAVIQEEPQVAEEQVRAALDLSQSFVNVAEAVTPAVVRIETERIQRISTNQQIPEQFRQFFGPRGNQPNEIPRVEGGSGFIVDPAGYILTNDHVVGNAESITVWLKDGQRYEAELVGTDPTTDVAVIRIDADRDLPTLSFGDSEEVRVGEWILAVGNPGFGRSTFDYTVTSGIVSAIGRPLDGLIGSDIQDQQTRSFAIEDFIQTDAVINPGNSGGPMVDLRGRVVGVNSAIATQTGFYQGYGFAIPINLARRVMEDLIEYGVVRRPYLGVSIQEIDAEIAEYYELPNVSGVIIGQPVDPSTPAGQADLEMNDIIVEIDGEPITHVGGLQSTVAGYRPGDRVEVTYYRDGARRTTEVVLREAPINRTAEAPQPTPSAGAEERIGIQVMDLTPEAARQLGYEDTEGVIISDVERFGPAARRGLVPNLKLIAIDDEPVNSAADVEAILGEVEAGQLIGLLVEDPQGNQANYVVRVPGN